MIRARTTPSPRSLRNAHPRRGGIYIAVLGASTVVTVIGISALAATRVRFATTEAAADATKARMYAESAVELALAHIDGNPSWRTARPHGTWAANVPLGDGSFTIEAIDPADGNLGNAPHDPVLIRGTGVKGVARHTVEVTLEHDGEPMDVLGTVLHTGGQLHVESGAKLTGVGAPISTNGKLYNEGTIDGDVEAAGGTESGGGLLGGLLGGLGSILGGVVDLLAPPKPMPPSTIVEMYAGIATPISTGGDIERRVLSPGHNPWGATNAGGVYLISSSGDVRIRDARIHGTLVVRCPGRTVEIDGNVLLEAARADYPVLVIDGDLVISFDGAPATLSESDIGANLNPAGAPYQGAADADSADTYPSEIRGLIYVRGRVTMERTWTMHGAVIADTSASSNAVLVLGNNTIVHDPALLENPPMGFTESLRMLVRNGTWRQATAP